MDQQDGRLPNTINELCDYIVQNADRIYVREVVNGTWGPHALSALPARVALGHALGFIKRRAMPVAILGALVLLMPGCFSSHEEPEPVSYEAHAEVLLSHDGCGAHEPRFFIGAEYDGEALVLEDSMLADPMGCAFELDGAGSCEFWDAGAASWEELTVERSASSLDVRIAGRIGSQPDANGYCMLFEYSLVGVR